MSDSQTTQLSQDEIYALQLPFVELGLESLAHGIFLLLAITAMFMLIKQGLCNSTARCYLFAAVLLVFLSTNIGWSMDFAHHIKLISLFGTDPVSNLVFNQLQAASAVCSRVNYVISDFIVVWRAWMLSDRHFLRIGLAACMVATCACTVAELVLSLQFLFSASLGNTKSPLQDLILFVPVLTTNILSTLIIAYKTWIYRREMKVLLNQESRRAGVEKILVLLLESGSIYAAYWILAVLAAFEENNIFQLDVIAILLPYFSAIYPIAIILLVAHGKTDELGHVTPIRFASVPARPTVQSGNSHSIIQSIADRMQLVRSASDEESRRNVDDQTELRGFKEREKLGASIHRVTLLSA